MVAENNETPVVQASVVQPAPQPQVMGAPVVAVVVGEKKVMMQGFTTFPQQHQCQWCGHTGMTKVTKEVCMGTHLACCGLCCIGCDLCCCFIPYCVDACKSTHHACAMCRQVVGISTFIAE
mmetsp:Transcript_123502/g.242274  ORF Transcript_123502/g.242274 Transcript_123502/m.242274 type:complete len:121 (-) Transcript_123502:94-456(-)